jgi:hypothetical protein
MRKPRLPEMHLVIDGPATAKRSLPSISSVLFFVSMVPPIFSMRPFLIIQVAVDLLPFVYNAGVFDQVLFHRPAIY